MFLPLVKMPALSSLVFSSCSCKISLPALLSALAKLRTLEDVQLSLHRISSPAEGSSSTVQPGRSDQQPQLRAVLPLLRIISVAADSASYALAASGIVTPLATSSLTRLKLNGSSWEQLPVDKANSDCQSLAVLGRCTTLQELEFKILLTSRHGAWAARSSAVLGDALQQLTALISLTLQPAGAVEGHAKTCVLCAADIAAGLLPLTALAALHLAPCYNETDRPLHLLAYHPQVLLNAMGKLPTLRSLSLCLHSLQRGPVVALGLKLTALTQLVLLASLFEGGQGAAARGVSVPFNLRCAEKVVTGMGEVKWPADDAKACEICPLAKQPRANYPRSDSEAEAPLQLVHTDMMEIRVPGLKGERYAVTLLDDYSRYAEVICVRTKDQVAEALVTRLKEWERQLQTPQKPVMWVKNIRSDNGTEFKGELKWWCSKRGIIMRH
eukprot:jgi/Ulvmu1/3439/UM016_0058.1